MERQEFLKSLGISFAAVCAGACLSACGGGDDTSTPGNTNPPPTGGGGNPTTVSANLSDLTTVGSSIKVSTVLFIRIAAGTAPASFVAIQNFCTHQGSPLNFFQAENIIRCSNHQAQFTTTGTVTSQPQGGGSAGNLKTYATTVNATQITATIT